MKGAVVSSNYNMWDVGLKLSNVQDLVHRQFFHNFCCCVFFLSCLLHCFSLTMALMSSTSSKFVQNKRQTAVCEEYQTTLGDSYIYMYRHTKNSCFA